MRKSKKVFNFSFLALLALVSTLIISLTTTKAVKADSEVAISAAECTDDSWKGTPTVTGVLHSVWTATSAPVTLEDVGGSKAFKFTFNKGGQYAGDTAIKFAKAYEKDNIGKITIKLFLHVSPNGNYQYSITPDANGRVMNGIFLLGSDKNGYGANGFDSDGYFIPQTIAQDTWVDLVLKGDDILPFLNADNKFDGLQFAARHDGGADTTVYATGNYFAVASVTVSTPTDEYTVSFAGDYGIEPQVVEKDAYATLPSTVPQQEGKRFAGWYSGNIRWFFDKYPVTQDLTLTAKFEDEAVVTLLDAAEYDNSHNACYAILLALSPTL